MTNAEKGVKVEEGPLIPTRSGPSLLGHPHFPTSVKIVFRQTQQKDQTF
jgi:hypothetical protein